MRVEDDVGRGVVAAGGFQCSHQSKCGSVARMMSQQQYVNPETYCTQTYCCKIVLIILQ